MKTNLPGSYPLKIYSPSKTTRKGTQARPPTPTNTGWPTTVSAGTGAIGKVPKGVKPTGYSAKQIRGGKGSY